MNHGAPEEILCRIKNVMAGFFHLPLEEIKNYSMSLNKLQGYGQPYIMSEEQKLDYNDLIFLTILPTENKEN